jgi:hypothetical protein
MQLTRKELHEMVWTKRSPELAAELGISVLTLAAICRRHYIDRPDKIHWTRMDRGERIEPPSLSGGEEWVVDIPNAADVERGFEDERDRQNRLVARERRPKFRIHVDATNGRTRHRTTSRIRKVLSLAKTDEYGCLQCHQVDLPFVRVSPGCVSRALTLMDTFLCAAEDRGFGWRVGNGMEWERSALLQVDGFGLRVGIHEKLQRRPYGLTAERTANKPVLYRGHMHAFVSVNQLSFRASNHETYTVDSPTRKVEDRLNDLMVTLIDKAFEGRRFKRRLERDRQEQKAEEATKAEIAVLNEKQEQAQKQLLAQAARWKTARDLRAFIAVVEASPVFADDARLPEWLQWACSQADRLDPLTNKLEDVLDVDVSAASRLEKLLRR